MAAATACRTSPALGCSQRCSADTNRASARTALMLGWCIADRIVSLLNGRLPLLHHWGLTLLAPINPEDRGRLVIHACCQIPAAPKALTLDLGGLVQPIRCRTRLAW